jgi:hypothetical protein
MLCIIGAVFLIRYRRPLLSKASFFLEQRRCLHFEEPNPNVPVYAYGGCWENELLEPELREKTPEWIRLVDAHPELERFKINRNFPNNSNWFVGRTPPSWREFIVRLKTDFPHAFLHNSFTEDFKSNSTAFLGTLHAPAGQEKLVVVDLIPDAPEGNIWEFGVATTIVSPATLTSPASIARNCDHSLAFLGDYQILWVYPGNIVPSDPASFESQITLPGAQAKLRGTLRDDGTLQLQVIGLPENMSSSDILPPKNASYAQQNEQLRALLAHPPPGRDVAEMVHELRAALGGKAESNVEAAAATVSESQDLASWSIKVMWYSPNQPVPNIGHAIQGRVCSIRNALCDRQNPRLVRSV